MWLLIYKLFPCVEISCASTAREIRESFRRLGLALTNPLIEEKFSILSRAYELVVGKDDQNPSNCYDYEEFKDESWLSLLQSVRKNPTDLKNADESPKSKDCSCEDHDDPNKKRKCSCCPADPHSKFAKHKARYPDYTPNSSMSPSDSAKKKETQSLYPSIMTPPVIRISNNQVEVSWTPIPGTNEESTAVWFTCQVRVKEIFGFSQPQLLYSGPECTYLARQIPQGRQVGLRVRATNRHGVKCPSWSHWSHVQVPGHSASTKGSKMTVVLSNVDLENKANCEAKKRESERNLQIRLIEHQRKQDEQRRMQNQDEQRRKEEQRKEEERKRKEQV